MHTPMIVGWGHTQFGKLDNVDIEQLIQQAASEAQLTTLDRVQGLARRTLRGEFGNGLERASRLGVDYAAVQNLINSGWRG